VWRVVYHAVSEVDEGVIVDRAALCEEASSAASQAIHDAITDCDDSPWLDAERAVRPDSEGAQPTNATAP
jgi:hypothetical protein